MARSLLLFSFLSLFTLSCGLKKPQSDSPPPPQVMFTDAELTEIGTTIADEWNAGSGETFDARFDPVEFFARMVWPHVPDQQEDIDFMEGYNADIEQSGKGLGGKLAEQFSATGTVRFLRVARDEEGVRLLFRLVGHDQALNYLELLIGRNVDGEPTVVDMYSAATGENLSRTLRQMDAGTGKGVLAKLLKNDKESVRQALAAAEKMGSLIREGKGAEALSYFDGLPAPVRKQKSLQIMRVRAAGMNNGDNDRYMAIIKEVMDLYPNDPGMDLLQIDYYFLRKEYDSLLAAYDRLDNRVQDPYLSYQRALVYIIKGEPAQAAKQAEGAIRRDSTLVEPYYVLITVGLQKRDHTAVADVLERMERSKVGIINFETIETDTNYTAFAASEQYRALKRKHDN